MGTCYPAKVLQERDVWDITLRLAPTFVLLWRDIMQASYIFWNGSNFRLGDESKIFFDWWHDVVKLEEMYPLIDNIALDKC